MKLLKWLVPLAIVVMILMIAIPAAADDPFGGPPSKTSGNGTTTWAAIYIPYTLDNKRSSNSFYKCPDTFTNKDPWGNPTGAAQTCEYDKYVTNWTAKVTLPAGGTRWFKFDTVKSRDVEVYVDDVPKWGAAYRYFDTSDCRESGYGGCDKADNLLRLGIDTAEIGKAYLATGDRYDIAVGNAFGGRDGIAARIYPPDFITRMSYFWPTPNNELLTTRAGSGQLVGETLGGRGGYGRGNRSVANETGLTYSNLYSGSEKKAGDGNTHLLSGKFHWDGWVYVRPNSLMIWDTDIMVGTRYTPNSKYDFPCDTCPYPFNP